MADVDDEIDELQQQLRGLPGDVLEALSQGPAGGAGAGRAAVGANADADIADLANELSQLSSDVLYAVASNEAVRNTALPVQRVRLVVGQGKGLTRTRRQLELKVPLTCRRQRRRPDFQLMGGEGGKRDVIAEAERMPDDDAEAQSEDERDVLPYGEGGRHGRGLTRRRLELARSSFPGVFNWLDQCFLGCARLPSVSYLWEQQIFEAGPTFREMLRLWALPDLYRENSEFANAANKVLALQRNLPNITPYMCNFSLKDVDILPWIRQVQEELRTWLRWEFPLESLWMMVVYFMWQNAGQLPTDKSLEDENVPSLVPRPQRPQVRRRLLIKAVERTIAAVKHGRCEVNRVALEAVTPPFALPWAAALERKTFRAGEEREADSPTVPLTVPPQNLALQARRWPGALDYPLTGLTNLYLKNTMYMEYEEEKEQDCWTEVYRLLRSNLLTNQAKPNSVLKGWLTRAEWDLLRYNPWDKGAPEFCKLFELEPRDWDKSEYQEEESGGLVKQIFTPCYKTLAYRNKGPLEAAILNGTVFPQGAETIQSFLVENTNNEVWNPLKQQMNDMQIELGPRPPPPPPLFVDGDPLAVWRPCSSP